MGKAALYHEDAQRLYVREGLSLDAIVGVLGKAVSRKTLFNWKKEGEWEDKRRKWLDQNKDIQDQLKNLVMLTLQNAENKPSQHNLGALLRAIQIFESYGGIKPQIENAPTEASKPTKDKMSPEALEAIKALYGLK